MQTLIGNDEWGAEAAARRDRRRARWLALLERVEALPPSGLALALLVPVPLLALGGSEYLLRVATLACIVAMLALGLSLVAGLAGLLDLGYVALFGVGAYTYAVLASPQLGLNLSFWLAAPLGIAAAALAGLLIAVPALRLSDDYLAIVTLAFAQVIGLLVVKLDRLELPGLAGRIDLTGGPNGLLNVAAPQFFGWQPDSQRTWFVLLVLVLALLTLLVGRLAAAPLGLAWRAMREDPLAAAAMGLPLRRLRLLAVCSGAAIAGLAGVLFASWQGAVFPANLDLALLLTLYAAIILGGLGSLPGALCGALLLTALPELLRDPLLGRGLIYTGALLMLAWPRRAAPLRFGWQRWLPRLAAAGGLILLWEWRLAADPAPARMLLIGGLLIALMIVRPQGLLGRPRVEVL